MLGERLINTGPADVDDLCAEVKARSLHDAVPALEALWRRFAGFGIRFPLPEQLAVLDTLASLNAPSARAALGAIVVEPALPESLHCTALRAAARASLALPVAFVSRFLDHGDGETREAAYQLACQIARSGIRLQDGLNDPRDSIRTMVAIALANRGNAIARPHLLVALRRTPTIAIIEAIAAIWNHEVIVALGRCAEQHPEFTADIIDILRDIDDHVAERRANSLESA